MKRLAAKDKAIEISKQVYRNRYNQILLIRDLELRLDKGEWVSMRDELIGNYSPSGNYNLFKYQETIQLLIGCGVFTVAEPLIQPPIPILPGPKFKPPEYMYLPRAYVLEVSNRRLLNKYEGNIKSIIRARNLVPFSTDITTGHKIADSLSIEYDIRDNDYNQLTFNYKHNSYSLTLNINHEYARVMTALVQEAAEVDGNISLSKEELNNGLRRIGMQEVKLEIDSLRKQFSRLANSLIDSEQGRIFFKKIFKTTSKTVSFNRILEE